MALECLLDDKPRLITIIFSLLLSRGSTRTTLTLFISSFHPSVHYYYEYYACHPAMCTDCCFKNTNEQKVKSFLEQKRGGSSIIRQISTDLTLMKTTPTKLPPSHPPEKTNNHSALRSIHQNPAVHTLLALVFCF